MAQYAPYIAAGAQLVGGAAGQEEGSVMRRHLRRRAGLRKATAQRAGQEERREARYLMSAARARMGNTADPTNVKILADLEARGEYNALMRQWEGDEEAEGDLAQADAAGREGDAQMFSSVLSAASTVGSSFYGKYGT